MELNKETYEKLDWRSQSIIKSILEIDKETKDKQKEAQDKIDKLSNLEPAKELKKFDYQNIKVFFDYGLNTYYSGDSSLPTPILTVEQLKTKFLESEEAHKQNLEICKHNQKLIKIAFDFLDKLGIPRKVYRFKSSRSRNKEWRTAEWVSQLESCLPITDEFGWNQCKNWFEKQIKAVEDYHLNKKKDEESKKSAEFAAEKAKQRDALIVKVVEKHKLDFKTAIPKINDVLEELAKKSKYLYLAYYLEKNRCDWNDNYSYAQHGLDYFMSHPDEDTAKFDAEIIDEISDRIENWDGDGRIFRGGQLGYEEIYEVASEEHGLIYNDFILLKEYEELN